MKQIIITKEEALEKCKTLKERSYNINTSRYEINYKSFSHICLTTSRNNLLDISTSLSEGFKNLEITLEQQEEAHKIIYTEVLLNEEKTTCYNFTFYYGFYNLFIEIYF